MPEAAGTEATPGRAGAGCARPEVPALRRTRGDGSGEQGPERGRSVMARARKAAAVAACALLAGCSAAAAPMVRTPPPGHFLVGAADSSYQAFQSSTGVAPAIVEHYIFPYEPIPTVFAGPAEPLVQIEPRNAPLSEVAAGKYDGWLRELAAQAKAYKQPIILGFAPEMNGSWYSWGYTHVTPAVYVAAWRHVVTVFRQAGADNVTWLWTVNVTSPGVSDPAQWWPGSAWVGDAGIDGYLDTASQTYAGKIAPTVTAIRRFWRGPVILSETSAAPQAGQVPKIADLFAGAHADHLFAVVWFDLPGNEDWVLKAPAALAAFRAAVKKYGQ
jgi:Glycosyl hydrolase family 26